ncbi:MAG: TonB-dependent receptor [Gammaproteobacteria bacterium]
MNFDRKYLVIALIYGALGMLLGIFMAATQNHAQHVTHAHLLLVGFVVSFVYAVIHRVWLGESRGIVPTLQFVLHHVGTVGMISGLFLMYSGRAAPATLEPLMAGSSLAVLAGLLLMLFLTMKLRGRALDEARASDSAPL